MKSIGSVLVLVIQLAAVSSSASAAGRTRVLTDYAATLWADADGHPVGAVSAIVQDRGGYLWVGSTAGLFRFDGVRLISWNQLSNTPLPATWVSSLLIAADGSLWVGFGEESTLAHVTGRSVQMLPTPAAGPLISMAQDADGAIWVVASSTLFRLDGSRWTRERLSKDAIEPRVQDVAIVRDGAIWVSTGDGVYERRSGSHGFEKLFAGNVWAVGEDRSGRMWVTDPQSGFKLYRIGSPPRDVAGVLGGGYRVMGDRAGNVWIGTIAEGLWCARTLGDGRTIVEKATLQSALFNDAVQSLFEDRDGNVWVGSTAGLHRLNRQALETVENEEIVNSVAATPTGGIWAAMPSGLVRFEYTDGNWTRTETRRTSRRTRVIARDANGALWIAFIVDGVGRLVGHQLETVSIPPELGVRSQISFIAADQRGGIWLGDGSGVLHWSHGRFTRFAPRVDDLTPRISFVRPDSKNRIWVAFADGRLGVQEGDGSFRVITAARQTLRAPTITAIEEGVNGTIWLATRTGLARDIDNQVVALPGDSGLPANRIWTVIEDGDGYLWADAGIGLLRIRPEEFDRALNTPAYHIRFEFFDASDGLSGATTITARAGAAGNGKVWFVRSGALTIADHQPLRHRVKIPLAPVIIDNIKANERTYAPDESVALTSDTKRIEIEYATVALSKSTRVRYRYRLEGLDSDWIQAGVRRAAVYTNLTPGTYRFLVQGGTDEDGWQGVPTSYGFEIHPAFYQTRAFAFAAAVMLVLLVFGAWRLRVRFVHRQYAAVLAERMRLSREIHDTLLQGVVGVALQLDNVSHDQGMPPASKVSLQGMRDAVEAYIREARQSIFDLRSPLLEEHDLVGALREVGGRGTANTPVRFSLTVVGQPKRYAARLENELLRIAQEAVTNAVRHANASHISVTVRFEPHHVSVEVADDGCGLARTAAVDETSHIGLASMKERAEKLGGHVTIRRSEHGGTAIEAILPIPTAA